MNTSFCTSCGAKHSYAYSPPKFCSNCGESTSGAAPKKQVSIARKSRSQQADDDDDDEDSSTIDYVPDIDAIDLRVEHDELMTRSLGSILQQTNDAPRPFERRSLDLDQLKNSRGKR